MTGEIIVEGDGSIEVVGNQIIQHETPEDFAAALNNSDAPRVHTFTNVGFLGLGANYSASFVDSLNNNVHGYVTVELEDLLKRVSPIYKTMEAANVPEVDGLIKVQPDSMNVYMVFQTDRPDEPDRVQASYDAWLGAVLELPTQDTIIQYVHQDEHVIIDATRGRHHFAAALDKNVRSLDSVLDTILSHSESFVIRDNTPIVQWYNEINNK